VRFRSDVSPSVKETDTPERGWYRLILLGAGGHFNAADFRIESRDVLELFEETISFELAIDAGEQIQMNWPP